MTTGHVILWRAILLGPKTPGGTAFYRRTRVRGGALRRLFGLWR